MKSLLSHNFMFFGHSEFLLFIDYQLYCGTLITPTDDNVKSSKYVSSSCLLPLIFIALS